MGGSGLTCYELALLGLPLITLNSSSVPSARILLPGLKMSVHLGTSSSLTQQKVFEAFKRVQNASVRRNFSQRAMQLVDGKGTERVIDILIELFRDIA